jgi:NAD(P)-dependent dehydrogenase (short-subunit alcohol dehydrogenase family)
MVTILQDMDVRDKRGHDERKAEYKVMPRLAGKTAIVTGGAKGIGRHYSQALAAEGARVMIADIADGRELAEEIAGRYGANSVASLKSDVSDEKAVKNLVTEASNASARSTYW